MNEPLFRVGELAFDNGHWVPSEAFGAFQRKRIAVFNELGEIAAYVTVHDSNVERVPVDEKPDDFGLYHGPAHTPGELKPCTRSRSHISAANAAMIARDGPAKFDYRAFPKECERMTGEARSTAKACPAGFQSYRNPDLCASSHQVDARFQLVR
jgi:hypothetical protein